MGRSRNGTRVSFDMLRAFTSLAKTLNLSETSESLGLTRQTVRRHISDLEAFRGGPLFTLKKHTYALTPLGVASLAGARSLLRQSESWGRGEVHSTGMSHHLEFAHSVNDDGSSFYSQQHPVSTVSRIGTPLVQNTLSAWGMALAQIEAEAMQSIRPHLAIYRHSPDGWICVEIGEASTYAKWLGWTWAKSAVGRLLEDDHAGKAYNRFIADAYERLHGEGGVRFDHIFAQLPRESSQTLVPVTFQRLLMGCIFPDDTPALALLASVTSQVDIPGLSTKERQLVSPRLLAEFDPTVPD